MSDELEQAKKLYEELADTIEEVGTRSIETIKEVNKELANQLADKQKIADIDANTLQTLLDIQELQIEAENRVKEGLGKKYEVLSVEERDFEIQKEKQKLLAEANQSIATQINYNERLMRLAGEIKDLSDDDVQNHERLKDFKRVNLDLEKKSADEIKKALGDYLKQANANKDLAKVLVLINTLLGRNKKQINEQEEQYNKVDRAAQHLAQRLFGINQGGNTFLGVLADSNMSMGELVERTLKLSFDDPIRSADALVAKLKEAGLNFLQDMMGGLKALDQSMVNLNRTAGLMFVTPQNQGAIGETLAGARAFGQEVSEFGISVEDQSRDFGDLINNSRAFATLTKQQRSNVAALSSTMLKAGISTTTFSRNFDMLNKTFGIGADRLEEINVRQIAFANALNIGSEEYIRDYTDAMRTLAVYGLEKGTREFERLKTTAVSTGVEMNNLLSIAARFDTFESAANMVGDLNAALRGPYFNTLEMINATESERIDILREGIAASGETFDTMDRYMQKFLMQQLGIQDAEVLRRILEGQASSVAEVEEKMRQQALTAEGLSEKLKANVSVQEKLNLVMDKFFREVLSDPGKVDAMIDAFKTFAEFLGTVAEFLGKIPGPLLKVIMTFSLFKAPLMMMINLLGMRGIMGALNALPGAGARAGMGMMRGLAKPLGAMGMLAGFGMMGSAENSEEGLFSKRGLGAGMTTVGGLLMYSGNPLGMAAGAALSVGGAILGYHAGTTYSQGGPSMIAERGPEMFGGNLVTSPTFVPNMARGETVLNNRKTNQILTTNNTIVTQVLQTVSDKLEQVSTAITEQSATQREEVRQPIVVQLDFPETSMRREVSAVLNRSVNPVGRAG